MTSIQALGWADTRQEARSRMQGVIQRWEGVLEKHASERKRYPSDPALMVTRGYFGRLGRRAYSAFISELDGSIRSFTFTWGKKELQIYARSNPRIIFGTRKGFAFQVLQEGDGAESRSLELLKRFR